MQCGWDQEADNAFQSLEAYLACLPKMASAMLGEPLLLYLVIIERVVSVILVVEQEKEQIFIYCMRFALAGVQPNYPLLEKFAYAMVLVIRKLDPYFKAHKVTVLTNQCLKNVL